jgi:hypothetical protein
MWRDFDIECIDKDIRILSEYGVKHMRVFPNWRDFQPVEPILGGSGVLLGYTVKEQTDFIKCFAFSIYFFQKNITM